MIKEWQKSDPETTDILKYRYKEMKKIGQTLIANEHIPRMTSMYLPRTGGKKKIGRNDPCPCGSGKKYKKCCGKL